MDIFLPTKLWYSRLRHAQVREHGADAAGDGELRDEGKVHRLGVSNFPSALVREALEIAPIITGQVEYHPYHP